MARTIRKYHDGMCLRAMSNRPHKQAKAMLNELVRDESLDVAINLGNRARNKAVPEPYDDICVAGLLENKHVWKHGQLPRPHKRYRVS